MSFAASKMDGGNVETCKWIDCEDFKAGNCVLGRTCKYAHGPKDRCGRQKCKTVMCEYFLAGKVCPYARMCVRAHGLDDLCGSELYKTRECTKFLKGECTPAGVHCFWAHGKHELRGFAATPQMTIPMDYLTVPKKSSRKKDPGLRANDVEMKKVVKQLKDFIERLGGSMPDLELGNFYKKCPAGRGLLKGQLNSIGEWSDNQLKYEKIAGRGVLSLVNPEEDLAAHNLSFQEGDDCGSLTTASVAGDTESMDLAAHNLNFQEGDDCGSLTTASVAGDTESMDPEEEEEARSFSVGPQETESPPPFHAVKEDLESDRTLRDPEEEEEARSFSVGPEETESPPPFHAVTLDLESDLTLGAAADYDTTPVIEVVKKFGGSVPVPELTPVEEHHLQSNVEKSGGSLVLEESPTGRVLRYEVPAPEVDHSFFSSDQEFEASREKAYRARKKAEKAEEATRVKNAEFQGRFDRSVTACRLRAQARNVSSLLNRVTPPVAVQYVQYLNRHNLMAPSPMRGEVEAWWLGMAARGTMYYQPVWVMMPGGRGRYCMAPAVPEQVAAPSEAKALAEFLHSLGGMMHPSKMGDFYKFHPEFRHRIGRLSHFVDTHADMFGMLLTSKCGSGLVFLTGLHDEARAQLEAQEEPGPEDQLCPPKKATLPPALANTLANFPILGS
eukprot:CAMPEP_0204315778 /NCGR_PEP_ID=MMETSP0469-20131031/5028_1 /ASSEMBLY_ACC=CAM_ASM_000384 /TAXON_ID=2969 /ORGANISM="Oxyrrhis marina" /LENGTH=669 /DNA_ID=CAMNT_0051296477 /DNA_START=68 /DNA_END=2077 /DNA_ORIENTATION=+